MVKSTDITIMDSTCITILSHATIGQTKNITYGHQNQNNIADSSAQVNEHNIM